jgi:hypothetical protein
MIGARSIDRVRRGLEPPTIRRGHLRVMTMCASVLGVIWLLSIPAVASAAPAVSTHVVAHSAGPSITVLSQCQGKFGNVGVFFNNAPPGDNTASVQITGPGTNVNDSPIQWFAYAGGPPGEGGISTNPGVYNVSAQWQTTGLSASFQNVSLCGATPPPCVGNGPAPPPITGFAASYISGNVNGYWKTDAAGGVSSFGNAVFHGSMGGCPLNQPVTGMVSTTDGGGYWLVAQDGGTFAFGNAGFYGSTGSMVLNAPIVSLASTADNHGYWLVAKDGGIFSYGDAQFHGSTGSMHLNQPVDGMAATPDGGGYWLVASDGGIFSFGDAGFFGSTGSLHLNAPIVGMVPTSDGLGYFLVGADGGVFTYGDAVFSGSTGSTPYNPFNPAVGVVPDTQLGNGSYWVTFRDGHTVSFGGAPNFG